MAGWPEVPRNEATRSAIAAPIAERVASSVLVTPLSRPRRPSPAPWHAGKQNDLAAGTSVPVRVGASFIPCAGQVDGA